jgi:hypothetical protein
MEDQLERKSKVVANLEITLAARGSETEARVIVATSEDPVLWNQVLGYIIHGGWGNEEEPPKPRRLP